MKGSHFKDGRHMEKVNRARQTGAIVGSETHTEEPKVEPKGEREERKTQQIGFTKGIM